MVKSPGSITTVKLIGSSETQQKAKSLIEEIVQLITDVDDVDKGVESMMGKCIVSLCVHFFVCFSGMGFSKPNAFSDYDKK